jgi:NAD(P)-dependent dehydrogenase (short-subunit alcohol dehydrogenase family)
MEDNRKMQMNHGSSLIVITGCDTGIGRSLAEVLAQRGFSIALSYLEKAPFENVPGIFQKKLDMRVPGEVEAFCVFVRELCQHGLTLKTVVSNAGVALGGRLKTYLFGLQRKF